MTRERIYLWRAAYAFLATPLLSLAALQAQFTISSWACGAHDLWTFHMISAISLLFAAAGGLLAYRGWRAIGSVRDLAGSSGEHWTSFLLVLGIFMSVLVVLLLLAMWLPSLLIDPCD
jgi:hypothetical protein